jgi:hypothetical protein
MGHVKKKRGQGTWAALRISAQSQDKERISFPIFLVSIQMNSI